MPRARPRRAGTGRPPTGRPSGDRVGGPDGEPSSRGLPRWSRLHRVRGADVGRVSTGAIDASRGAPEAAGPQAAALPERTRRISGTVTATTRTATRVMALPP